MAAAAEFPCSARFRVRYCSSLKFEEKVGVISQHVVASVSILQWGGLVIVYDNRGSDVAKVMNRSWGRFGKCNNRFPEI